MGCNWRISRRREPWRAILYLRGRGGHDAGLVLGCQDSVMMPLWRARGIPMRECVPGDDAQCPCGRFKDLYGYVLLHVGCYQFS
jgi:hypothetical protein